MFRCVRDRRRGRGRCVVVAGRFALVCVRSEERRVGKSVDLGGRRIIKKKNNNKKKKKEKNKINKNKYNKTRTLCTVYTLCMASISHDENMIEVDDT